MWARKAANGPGARKRRVKIVPCSSFLVVLQECHECGGQRNPANVCLPKSKSLGSKHIQVLLQGELGYNSSRLQVGWHWGDECSLLDSPYLVQAHTGLGSYTASPYFFHPLVENLKMNSNAYNVS